MTITGCLVFQEDTFKAAYVANGETFAIRTGMAISSRFHQFLKVDHLLCCDPTCGTYYLATVD